MWGEIWGKKDEFNIADLVLSPFMTTEVVKQHCGMDAILLELSIESFHHIGKNLSCHPCCLVTEVPETPLLASFLLEASWLLCITNEETGTLDDGDRP